MFQPSWLSDMSGFGNARDKLGITELRALTKEGISHLREIFHACKMHEEAFWDNLIRPCGEVPTGTNVTFRDAQGNSIRKTF